MKKVLSLVLVLSMILGSFGMVFAATPSDVVGRDCEAAVAVLTDLGVVSGYKDGTYKPEGIVTRAEMATLIVKALGLEGYATGTSRFSDMSGNWADGYVAYANTLGILSGYADGTFRPNQTVTCDQAITMIINALGYTADSLNGTYPGAFVSKAKTLGVLDGVRSGSTGANRGDVAIMLYNALDQAIGKVNKDGDWTGIGIKFNSKGEAVEYDTMLNRLDAKVYEPSKSDYAMEDVDDNAFILTDSMADDAVANVKAYVGAVVTAYVNDDDEIIAIKECFSDFVTGSFNSKGDVFEADEGDFDMSIGSGADSVGAAFLNGAADKTFDVQKVEVKSNMKADDLTAITDAKITLAVDLSGKKIKEVYSVAYWKVTEEGIVDKDDVADIHSNHKLLGVDLPEDDDDELDMTAVEFYGITDYDGIKEDSVVYIYAKGGDSNNEAARVAVGNNRASGEVSRVKFSGDDVNKITVSGTEYKFALRALEDNNVNSEVTQSSVNKIESGDDITLYLDAYGYIYDFDRSGSSATDYAVVLKWEDKEGNKISSDPKLKLLLADGSTKTFNVDDDEDNDFIGYIMDKDGQWTDIEAGMLIKYGVDKNGDIDSIEAVGNNDDELTVVTNTIKKDVSSKGYWNGKKIAENAALFAFDTTDPTNDEDDYSIIAYKGLCGSDDVTARRYVIDDNEIVAMLLEDDFSSGDSVWGVVDGRAKNNSDAGAEITMWIDGSTTTYNADDGNDAYGKAKGNDLFKVEFDTNGDISKLKRFVDEIESDDELRMATTGAISGSASLSSNTFKYSGMTETTSDGKALATEEIDDLTIDSDVVIYVMNEDGDWNRGSRSDLRNLKEGDEVSFYDVADNDGVYDIVIIIEH